MPEIGTDAAISRAAWARIAGVFYLFIIAAGLFAEAFVRDRLAVAHDPAATARNIASHEGIFRLALAAELLHLSLDVAVAAILYVLLRPLDRTVSLIAAFLRLASDAVYAIVGSTHLSALFFAQRADDLRAFDREQRDALAFFSLKLHDHGYAISLVFFGFCLLALGHLVFRSREFPRPLGVFLAVAGAGYLVNSFAKIAAPAVASALFPWTLLPGFVAGLWLALWLTFARFDSAGGS